MQSKDHTEEQKVHSPAEPLCGGGQPPAKTLRVTPAQVFNLPLYSIYIVIDCRTSHEYSANHIVGSHSLPPPASPRVGAEDYDLENFVNSVIDHSPEHCSPVVICGNDNDPRSKAHVKWVSKWLWQMASLYEGKSPKKLTDKEPYNPVHEFGCRLAMRLKQVWIVEGGFTAFESEFPFLCSPEQTVNDMLPTPAKIMPGLYMGSRPLMDRPEYISRMNFTHVVLDRESELKLVVCGTYGRTVPINKVVVEHSGDFTRDVLAGIVEYVGLAVAEGGKVLVQVEGRLRSGTIVLAYLMSSRRMSLEAAVAELQRQCYKTDSIIPYLPVKLLKSFGPNPQPAIAGNPPCASLESA